MENLKLSDFVSQALVELINGVSVAQGYAIEKDAAINPRHVNWSDTKQNFFIAKQQSSRDDSPIVTKIEFDIAVTASKDDQGNAAIGVFGGAFGIGVKGETKDHSAIVNRVKFDLLVKLPQHSKSKKGDENESE